MQTCQARRDSSPPDWKKRQPLRDWLNRTERLRAIVKAMGRTGTLRLGAFPEDAH